MDDDPPPPRRRRGGAPDPLAELLRGVNTVLAPVAKVLADTVTSLQKLVDPKVIVRFCSKIKL
jgi:hypothetical protein